MCIIFCHSLSYEGVVPVDSVVPCVNHFHSMLEAARLSKALEGNTAASVGDLGQRIRMTWKQISLMDERAISYINHKVSCVCVCVYVLSVRPTPLTDAVTFSPPHRSPGREK